MTPQQIFNIVDKVLIYYIWPHYDLIRAAGSRQYGPFRQFPTGSAKNKWAANIQRMLHRELANFWQIPICKDISYTSN